MAAARWFKLQTEIHFGSGAIRILPYKGRLCGKRALLVTGKQALSQNGILDEITDLLKVGGVKSIHFAEVEPEPTLATVEKGLAVARAERADLVIGLGGGSVMDVAKVIAGLYHSQHDLKEYFDGLKLETPGIPLITIPTVAGSGAEVTVSADLMDTDRRIKRSISSPYFAAQVAIVDPRFTVSTPPDVTAYSGFDALVHAIEALTSKGAGPLTDIYAYRAIEKIGSHICQAVQDGSDLAAREAMAEGSLMAGVALTNARLGAVHGLANAIGARAGKPHGLVSAVLLVPVLRFNMAVSYERYAQMAKALGCRTDGMDPIDAAALGIKTIMILQKKLGIPATVRYFGLDESEYQQIATESIHTVSMKANPRDATLEDIVNILKERF